MFSIPTIPNDTINKFFVFSGLILTVFGYYMTISNINDEANILVQNRKHQDSYIESLTLFTYKAKIASALIECSKASSYSEMIKIRKEYEIQMNRDSSIGLAFSLMLLSDTSRHALKARASKIIEELYLLEGTINTEKRAILMTKSTAKNNPFDRYILIGSVIFIIGYFGWSKAERRQELNADLQLLKLARELNVEIPHLKKYNNPSLSANTDQTPTSADITE